MLNLICSLTGEAIKSSEGTTQGDPLAMPMYAIATVPLIQRLTKDVKQVWYADDAASLGKVDQIRSWCDRLVKPGPGYGYYPNAAKTWLVTKEEHVQIAPDAFEGTGVKVTSHGRPYLRAPIGNRAFIESFVKKKVDQWITELDCLTTLPKHSHV